MPLPTSPILRATLRCVPALLAFVAGFAVAQTVHEVGIREYRFEPAELRIKAGDAVRWSNREKRTSHSVVFPAEGGLESERMFPGESWQRTFDQRGRHDYQCGPHPEMKGVVLVED